MNTIKAKGGLVNKKVGYNPKKRGRKSFHPLRLFSISWEEDCPLFAKTELLLIIGTGRQVLSYLFDEGEMSSWIKNPL